MSESLHFYQNLPAISDFIKVMDHSQFHEAPQDWVVVMTDVRGSTEAIRKGRYRDVNMLGASCITAILNAIPDVSIPYVFGGDGATLLIPESVSEKVTTTLVSLQTMSQTKFGMELRAGLVPLRKLKELGSAVSVAKYELSPGNVLAQFSGGGVSKAEELIKSDREGLYNLASRASTEPPDLTGLSCRLEPFESRRGTMLTLLVSSLGTAQANSETYAQVINTIEKILGHPIKSANPVTGQGLRWKWPPKSLLAEVKSHTRNPLSFPLVFLRVMIGTLISHILLHGTRVVGGFDPTKYKKELVMNSDYTKFDDVLRMVVDCSHTEADEIEKYLKSLFAQKLLRFGVHRSPQALMTCMVFSATNNRHIHFIDGSHGGYAMAAVGLKSQKVAPV